MNNYSKIIIFSNLYLDCPPNTEILKTPPKIATRYDRAVRSFSCLLMLQVLA